MKTEVHSDGYIYIVDPQSPMADKRGRVLKHRYVMAESIGRTLQKSEIVHHVDGNKMNNSISNLKLMRDGDHTKLHHPEKLEKTNCAKCGKEIERAQRKIRGKLTFCCRSCSTIYYASIRSRKEIEHGTYGRYRKGCRCELCKNANNLRIKKYRAGSSAAWKRT